MSVTLGKDTKPIMTNANGVYKMENVTSGAYEIEVCSEALVIECMTCYGIEQTIYVINVNI